jgi:genome maintenance exonuclease 1
VWGQECALYSPSLEVAGRCDLVGKYKGIPVIVDFKTAGRVKGHKDIGDYKLQLAFYACAHNEMFGTNIRDGVILMVAQTGFPMEFNVFMTLDTSSSFEVDNNRNAFVFSNKVASTCYFKTWRI